MKKVFVAGGAGFIGSHLVATLLRDQAIRNVVVFDNFTSGRHCYIPSEPGSRLSVIEGDLKDIEAVKAGMIGCDCVFHLAANPDIAKAVTQPDIDFWEGTYLTQNVLEAMRATGTKSIIYTSGSGVYGENPKVPFREDYGPCIPISTYGASKLACEGLVAAYCHMFGMRGRAFRFANVVGPRQTHGVGYDFVRHLRRDPTRLQILGNGKQSKSYIHIDDVLAAIFKANTYYADYQRKSSKIVDQIGIYTSRTTNTALVEQRGPAADATQSEMLPKYFPPTRISYLPRSIRQRHR